MKKVATWLSSVFGGKRKDQSVEVVDFNPSSTPVMNLSDVNSAVTGIEWIDNDGLLRDEGVLFGIAQADISEKKDAIHKGFDKAKAEHNIRRTQLLQALEQINAQKEDNQKTIGQTKIEILELRSNKISSDTKVFPTLVQLVAYGFISYLNFYLLSFWLKPIFFDNFIIPIGIYCFGMLSVFVGKALVYNSNTSVQNADDQNNRREKWKIWAEEFGVPLVVATFIVLVSVRTYPVEWSIGGFILFFFLFSFAGKGLINSMYRCHNEFKQLRLYFGKLITRSRATKTKQRLIKRQEAEASDLESNARKVRDEIALPDTKLGQLDALLAYKINIFESEYMLASNATGNLSTKQKASFQI